MTTALPFLESTASGPASTTATVSLTDIRRFVQSRAHDHLLLGFLEAHFDSTPARAMLHNRLPPNRWMEGQVLGADFHDELIDAVEQQVAPEEAAPHLRPALRILRQFHFEPLPEIRRVDQLLLDSAALGLRGKADLVGHLDGHPAVIEIKTVHAIPENYALLEHSLQASALFALAWNRPPRPNRDRVAVLYVSSTAPHRAFLRSVQLPHRFVGACARIANHLLGRS